MNIPKYNQRETFEAILRGEIVVSAKSRRKVWLEGDEIQVGYVRGSQPLRALSFGSDPYVEPNPHTPGTFAWARFENKTKRVMRPGRYYFESGQIEKHYNFTAADFDATELGAHMIPDLACKHGYCGPCSKCDAEGMARADAVREHYAPVRRLSRENLRNDKWRDCPPHTRQQGLAAVPPRREVIGSVDLDMSASKRCACGSKLSHPPNVALGVCHWCQTGEKPEGWNGERCACGSMLVGAKSQKSGNCSKCRHKELSFVNTHGYYYK